MSRVTYTNIPDRVDQEEIRASHRVRLVSEREEGTSVNALPPGVYGFTYSPGLPNAPLFAVRRYRGYETHKLPNGEIFIIGFATSDGAAQLSSTTGDVTIQAQPEPEESAMLLV